MGLQLKKLSIVLVGITTMIFLYLHQLPTMSTIEAIISSEKHLQHPPEEWGKSILYVEIKDIPFENISAVLNPQNGFWNQLTNQMQWEVTVKYNGIEPTIVMDAGTGKLIEIFGPLN